MRLQSAMARQGKRLCKMAFPKYTGRKINLRVTEEFRPQPTYWDGGTMHEYAGVHLGTHQVVNGNRFNPPQFGGPNEINMVKVPINMAVIEHTYFGVSQWMTIFLHPQNANLLQEVNK